MPGIRKVSVLITRHGDGGPEVCVFDHPRAGTQLPAGTLLPGEAPAAGALREGFEETGLTGLRVVGELAELETAERRHLVHLVLDEAAADEWYVGTPDGGGHCWRCHWVPVAHADVLVKNQQEWLDRARSALLRADHPPARRRPPLTDEAAVGPTIEIFWAPPWSGSRALMSWLDATADMSPASIHRAEGAAFTDAGLLVAVCDAESELWTLPGGRRESGESAEEVLGRELAEEACARMELAELAGYQRFHHLDGSRAGRPRGGQAGSGSRSSSSPLTPV